MSLAGVYEIRNSMNGDRYIGSSQDVEMRFYHHLSELKHQRHHNIHLQRAWNKYGEDRFEMNPLIFCDEDMTLLFEQMMLDNLDPEYNIAECAEASARGAKRSKETRRKISEAQKGRKQSKEAIRKSVISRRGYKHSERTKELISKKISEWHKTEKGRVARKNAIKAKQKKIRCLENGKVYPSIKAAAKELGVLRSQISAVAKGKRSHTGGYRFVCAQGEKARKR